MRTSLSAVASSLSAFALCTLLAGCSSNFNPLDGTTPPASQIGAIKGKVYGGQQPVSGAAISLYAASTTGYGAASTSLLTTGVTTGTSGQFSLTGDYVCVAGTQVYLYAKGGNAGGGTNADLGFLAVLGQCPATGTLAATVPFLIVNEATTVAAAYALAGFAVDATHVGSSGTPLAQTGIANAFATAGNLVSVATADQGALVTTPGGNGTVPQAEINTLADILAACVNSTGATSTPCKTLLADALSAGTTGTAPTDTATAAINIAHNPTANIAALYALATATAPFQPTLTAAPNDWTVLLGFTDPAYQASFYLDSNTLAVDGSGNIWNANATGNTITELSPLGATLSGNGYSDAATDYPFGVAIDTAGNAWVANTSINNANYSITKFGPLGASSTDYNSAALGLSFPLSLAFDGTGNLFVANNGDNNILKLSSAGALLKTGAAGAEELDGPYAIALTEGAAGSAWVANAGNEFVSLFSNAVAGTKDKAVGGANFTTNGVATDATGNSWVASADTNMTAPMSGCVCKITAAGAITKYSPGSGQMYVEWINGVVLDGAANVWSTDFDNATIYETSSAGTTLSGTYGFIPTQNTGYGTASQFALVGPNAIAVDGSGNVWYSTLEEQGTTADNVLYEIVGAAVPTITPIAEAVATSKIGTKP